MAPTTFHCHGSRAKFKLNTNGYCFICLRNVGWSSSSKFGSDDGNLISLSVLIRYLQISPQKILTAAFEKTVASIEEALQSVNKSDFVVEICERCKKIVERASELVRMLELINMELGYCVGNIRDCLEEGDGDPATVEEYMRTMTENFYTVTFLQPTENLRRKFADKCSKILSRVQPRVRVERIAGEGKVVEEEEMVEIELSPFPVENPENPLEETSALGATTGSQSPVQIHSNQLSDTATMNEEAGQDQARIKQLPAYSLMHSMNTRMTRRKSCRRKSGNLITNSSEAEALQQSEEMVQIQESVQKSRFKCNSCPKTFVTKVALDVHFMAIHLKRKFPCPNPGCSEFYRYSYQLTAHAKECEWKVGKASCGPVNSCGYCKKIFPNSSQFYSSHVAKCAKKSLATISCDECHKTFWSQLTLKRHMKYAHEKSQKYPCNRCNKIFFLNTNLTQHFKSVHLGVRYSCSFPGCQRKYSNKGVLTGHARRDHPDWKPAETSKSQSGSNNHDMSTVLESESAGLSLKTKCVLNRKMANNELKPLAATELPIAEEEEILTGETINVNVQVRQTQPIDINWKRKLN